MPQENYYIAHWGIKGQKWGLRRFRNYDDTLTEAGKRRYGDGGARAIKKAEKERQRRAQILADPTKLYKHRSEFTNAEIENAMAKFDTAARLKEAARKEKAERRADLERKILGGTKEERLEKAAVKEAYKTKQIEEEAKREKAKALAGQQKQTLQEQKAQAARNAAAEERKIEKEKRDEKASRWERRAKKYKGVWETSTSLKSITDALGITSKDTGTSIFGALGSALGLANIKASDVDDSGKSEKESKSDSSEKSKKEKKEASADASPKQDAKDNKPSSSASGKGNDDAFAGWATDNEYKDTSKKEAKAAKKARKEDKRLAKEAAESSKDSQKAILDSIKEVNAGRPGSRDQLIGNAMKKSMAEDELLSSVKSSLGFLKTFFRKSIATDAGKDDFVDAAAEWAKTAYSKVPVSKIEDIAEDIWKNAPK